MSVNNRLGEFIANLALDTEKLERFRRDAEAEMTGSGLNEEEKAVVAKGDFRMICDYLGEVGPRPLQAAQGGGG